MKVVLTIAGSDSSGGAGLQADLKTFEAFGVFGSSVVTVLTAQNTQGVSDVFPISPDFIQSQLKAVFEDFEVSAIKIGMLFSNDIIDVVREYVKNLNIPIVFDPVFISKAGSKLLNDDAIENLKSLVPYCTLITPNLFEAKEIFGYEFANSDSLDGVQNTSCAVLIKNHIMEVNDHQKRSVDTLYIGREKRIFDTPYLETNHTHGTGCSYSSAIAANLALGKTLEESIQIAKKFIYLAVKNAPEIGTGHGPIAHKIGGGNMPHSFEQKLKGLYVITDDILTPDATLLEQVEESLKGGAKIVQLRDKLSSKKLVKQKAIVLQKLCKQYDALFVLNDKVDIAIELQCDGLHIGKSDYDSFEKIRKLFNGVLGVSCYSSIEDAKRFQYLGANYVAFGSFFQSPTKPDSTIIPLEILSQAYKELDIPICAIGGIATKNIEKVMQHNPHMVSLISDIWMSDNIQAKSKFYANQF